MAYYPSGLSNISPLAATRTIFCDPPLTSLQSGITYFSYFTTPQTAGVGQSAYTIYIAGAPTGGFLANSYSLYVASGMTLVQSLIVNGSLTLAGSVIVIGSQSFSAPGSSNPSSCTLYVNPASTALSGASNYYFTYLNAGPTTGSTSGNTYTLYIEGASTGGANNYSLYINSGKAKIADATTSSSPTTGALVVSGGVGIGGNLNVGGNFTIEGTFLFSGMGSTIPADATIYVNPTSTVLSGSSNYYFTYFNAPPTSSDTSGSVYTVYIAGAPANTGGGGLSYSLYINSGMVGIADTTASTSTTTGALVVAGGVGIGQSLNVGGTTALLGQGNSTPASASLYVSPASTALSGSSNYYFNYLNIPITSGPGTTGNTYNLYIAGAPSGGSFNYALYISSGMSLFADTTASTNATSGALVVSGGVGIGQTLNVAGSVVCLAQIGATAATSPLYVDPASTALSGFSNYYSAYFAAPITTGAGTSGNTYNLYIAGAASGPGGAFNYALFINSGISRIADTTNSTTTTTGCLTLAGGMGIADNLNVGGNIVCYSQLYAQIIRNNAVNPLYIAPEVNASSGIMTVQITPAQTGWSAGGTAQLEFGDSNHYIEAIDGSGMTIHDSVGIQIGAGGTFFKQILSGMVTFTNPNLGLGGTATSAVIFSTAYGATPVILVTLNSSGATNFDSVVTSVQLTSNAGFTIEISNAGALTTSGSVVVNWFAIL